MNREIENYYGCTHNPFLQSKPVHGLYKSTTLETFKFRIKNLATEGGFALLTGEPGLGKSALLRSLAEDFKNEMSLTVVEISRPQSSVADFYRELGETFGVELKLFNKFHGFKSLRSRWAEHMQKSLLKPLIIIDEIQEAKTDVLSELRLLSSTCFDSKLLVTTLLSGDHRIVRKLKSPQLLPLFSRIGTKLDLKPLTKDEMKKMLIEVLGKSGAPNLITPSMINLIAEKSLGNPRLMMNTCQELLVEAFSQRKKEINEDVFLRLYGEKMMQVKNKKSFVEGEC